MAVLPHAKEKGFELACPYPSWPHRGLPVFEGGKHSTLSSYSNFMLQSDNQLFVFCDTAELLLRTDAARDKMDGFFVALFVRSSNNSIKPSSVEAVEAVEAVDTIVDQDAKSSLLRRRKLKRQRKKEQQAINAKVN